MAGGVITTALCIAVADAGGLPFIASGYLTSKELEQQISDFELKSNSDFGINLFYPEKSRIDESEYSSYKKSIRIDHKDELLPAGMINNDDFFYEKLNIALSSKAKYLSFTFGHPHDELINKIRSAGKTVILYATSESGILYIENSAADIIGIQCVEAGGHQASVYSVDDNKEPHDIDMLIEYALSISNKKIIVAGGVSTKNDVLKRIRQGVAAVQVGTMFLLANESGTKDAHKYAILNFKNRKTILTKSFTGKLARAIDNDFIRKYDDLSIEGYPEVHYLTRGIRAEANRRNDPENLNLWAGCGFINAYQDSAENIIKNLTPYVLSRRDYYDDEYDIFCVVGGGPRGLALIERLISKYNFGDKKISIHWFDDALHGPGRIWNPYKPTYFLMNTVCSQLSAFPDESTGFNDGYISGPTMYAWLTSNSSLHWLTGDEELLRQRENIFENSYPSRSLYGAYLSWAAEKIISTKSDNISLVIINDRVKEFVKVGSKRKVTTSSGNSYEYDYIMLALGHINSSMNENEILKKNEFASYDVYYIPSGDADINRVSKIKKGKNALFFGIGLTFFDYMESLTAQRGGEFVEDELGVLNYKASGNEPKIFITSRTGVPYHARGYNEKKPDERWEPRFITEKIIASLQENTGNEVSFGKDLWDKIVKEIELAYTISELNDQKYEESIIEAISLGGEFYKNKRKSLGLSPYGFPWEKVLHPKIVNQTCYSLDEYQKLALSYLQSDIEDASGGNKSNPFKCALDVLRDIRNEVRLSIQSGGISDRSYQDEINYFYTPMNAFLSIGPPVQRIKELSAIVRCGIAKIIPPNNFYNYDKNERIMSIGFKEPFFQPIKIDYVIDARQQKFIMSKSTDLLMKNSIKQGVLSSHIYSSGIESGAIDISHQSFNIIDVNGVIDKKVFCYGVPTEGITWGTAATIRPFVNSAILQDAEKIVNKIIEVI